MSFVGNVFYQRPPVILGHKIHTFFPFGITIRRIFSFILCVLFIFNIISAFLSIFCLFLSFFLYAIPLSLRECSPQLTIDFFGIWKRFLSSYSEPILLNTTTHISCCYIINAKEKRSERKHNHEEHRHWITGWTTRKYKASIWGLMWATKESTLICRYFSLFIHLFECNRRI